ncbi:MAG TPA: amidase [Acidimicrobiales bacterium]|nr:amidase [Acidimicrobiales bacterium]
MTATYTLPLDEGRAGARVAVKDLLDWAGTPTTAGSRAVAATATPATADAACLAGLRAAVADGRARVIGKANLHELALGTTGVNPWFGTPVNPRHPGLVPGGSSSGSAVAVAEGSADWAVGTDTGGSVRIPAACCGVAGLKTSRGRLPLDGVWPLAPSLDTVGPLAPSVAGLVAAMAVLDPAFDVAVASAALDPASLLVGRVRPGVALHPAVDAAVDAALAALGAPVTDVALPGWGAARAAADALLGSEAAGLFVRWARRTPSGVSDEVRAKLDDAATVGRQRARDARAACDRWAATLTDLVGRVTVLALPTLPGPVPRLDADDAPSITLTVPVNAAGLPALALPVPWDGPGPCSLQLIAPPGGDELLCRVGAAVEAALDATGRRPGR